MRGHGHLYRYREASAGGLITPPQQVELHPLRPLKQLICSN
jgi:hypothetical protein